MIELSINNGDCLQIAMSQLSEEELGEGAVS